MKKSERSESGAPIHRHQRRKDFGLSLGDDAAQEKILDHIGKHVGEPATVYHGIVSEYVHIDIHIVQPTKGKDYYTLITSGMSDQPMHAPRDAKRFRYAELFLCLPASWSLSEDAIQHEENYWPIRWLKILARFPHEYDTWLWASHTVPNGDPPEPFASNTKLCCAFLGHPISFDEDFFELKVNQKKTIYFLSFLPIYKEEMRFKLKHGYDPLLERLMENGVTELLDIRRKNVCRSGS